MPLIAAQHAGRFHANTFDFSRNAPLVLEPSSACLLQFCLACAASLPLLLGGKPEMVVGVLRFRATDEIPGEIEHPVAGELVLSEAHSVPAERKGGRWPVFDGLPPVEAHMQNERALHFNEKIAMRRQCIERSVGTPMPSLDLRDFATEMFLDAVQ